MLSAQSERHQSHSRQPTASISTLLNPAATVNAGQRPKPKPRATPVAINADRVGLEDRVDRVRAVDWEFARLVWLDASSEFSVLAVDRDCQRIADFAYADVAETTEAIGQRRDRNVLD